MDNEVYPLRNINLEEKIVPHQFVYYIVDSVVELQELLELVVLIVKNVLGFWLVFLNFLVLAFKIFSHVEEKFKKKFTDAKIFTDHLPLVNGTYILEIRLLFATVFQEVLDFFNLFSDLHHAYVRDLLGRLLIAPFEVFSEVNDA